MPATEKPSARVGRTKSRNGCITCKIRRIKCSEEKPHCYRCTSTGRKCEYKREYDTSRQLLSRHSLSPVLSQCSIRGTSSWPVLSLSYVPQLWASVGDQERRAFEFYFYQAAPALSPIFDLSFWRGTVLQICRVEPAIWDAIVSMSALYELPSVAGCLSPDPAGPILLKRTQYESHERALSWYSRSIGSIREKIRNGKLDRAVSLVSCALFIVIEILQGNMTAARALYYQGVHLLASKIPGMMHTPSMIIESSISPVIMRMGTLILIIAGVPLASPAGMQHPELNITSMSEAKTALYTMVAEFKTFDWRAKRYLNEIYHINGPGSSNSKDKLKELAELKSQENTLLTKLEFWHRQFTDIPAVSRFLSLHRMAENENPRADHAGFIATLLMAHKNISILTKTSLVVDEMVFDKHDSTYADILALAPIALESHNIYGDTQPLFGFEMESGLPLFVMITRCRDPLLRRKALTYLLKASPVNGFQMAVPAARTAAAIIELEEHHIMNHDAGRASENLTGILSHRGRVPGAGERISEFRLLAGESGGQTHYSICYKRFAPQIKGRWGMVEETRLLPNGYTMPHWPSAF